MKQFGFFLTRMITQLVPLTIKLWLVNHIPPLRRLNHQVIKLRLKSKEFSKLSEILTKTSNKLDNLEVDLKPLTILVLSISTQMRRENPLGSILHENQGKLSIVYQTINLDRDTHLDWLPLCKKLPDFDYLCVKKEEDVFLSNALIMIASELQSSPANAIYWDHVTFNDKGIITDHSFKPDWAPDYFYCYNYINRAALIAKENVHFDKSSLDILSWQSFVYLSFTKIIEQKKNISHIAEPLQKLKQDSQQENTRKNEIETKIVKQHLLNKAEVSCHDNGIRDLTWLCPLETSSTIIIPTRDGYEILKKCIDSIVQSKLNNNDEILIINNQSTCLKTINYLDSLKINSKVRVLSYNKEFNYSAINNFAVKQCNSDIVVLLNNDTEIINNNWLQQLKANAIRPEIGCVGAKLYYPDKTIQHGGVIIGYGGVADHAFKYEPNSEMGYMQRLSTNQNYSAVTAACLAIKRNLYLKVDGLDEENLKVAFNDIDLNLKCLALGYRNIWLKNVELYHYESKSRGADISEEKRKRFQTEIDFMKKKWNTDTALDPYFNKNLSLQSHFYTI